MSENILLFLLFAIAVLVVYYIVKPQNRKYVLLVGSVVFYCIVSKWLFFLLAAELLYSYVIASFCVKRSVKKMFFPILPVLLVLLFFKYSGFFAETLQNGLAVFGLGSDIHILKLILPIGISFYTFKIISFMIDVCRKKMNLPGFWDYCTYVMCFTQILSGPIQKPEEFLTQINNAIICDKEQILQGMYRIMLGLFKKLVIAARCTDYVTAVFYDPQRYPVLSLWMAAFLFSIELYADFSGYSDISIGLMQMMGISVKENFASPYFSHNIKEFWNRWHISLSTWLKDYIYIPLGGNRCSILRQKINIMLTFLISGVWHGAGWNYVLWGGIHGVLNCLTPSKESGRKKGIKGIASILITYICVNFAWIVFRADSLKSAWVFMRAMFTRPDFSFGGISQMLLPFTGDNTCAVYALILFVYIICLLIYDGICYYKKEGLEKKMLFAWQVFLVVSIILFGVTGGSGFIYAQY